MKHLVMFSGGIGSWAAAKRVVAKHGKQNVILLFTDVKGFTQNEHVGEDLDTYRFLNDAAKNLGVELIKITEGRDIWEVFKDKRFLGNSRLASCSHELKQKPARAWLEKHFTPEQVTVYLGIDWSEIHRLPAIEKNYLPYTVLAPLCEKPYLNKSQLIQMAKLENLQPPRLYEMGFSHNNCGGGCVRAGQGQFKHLLQIMPERYAVWEQKEKEMQHFLEKNVTILKETVRGETKNLSLTELRQRYEMQPSLIDEFEIGGCNCFYDYDETEATNDNTTKA